MKLPRVQRGGRWLGVAATSAAALLAAGCSTVPGGAGFDRTVQLSGAQPVSPVEVETVNLLQLLDPGNTLPGLPPGSLPREQDLGKMYDLAFARFPYLGDSEASARQRRNLVQNRVLMAADRRCGRFLQHLKIQNADTNFGLGIATVVAAAAAAVVPGARDAKTLSAIGAVTSGARAEYNNEYFSNLSVSIVTKAIEQHRAGMRATVVAAQGRPYASYDIAAAVGDAIRYDAACNVLSGLETANEAVQRMNEPGREAVKNALFNDRVTRAVAEGNWQEVQAMAQMAGTVKQAYLPTFTAMTPATSTGATGDATAVTAVGLLTAARGNAQGSLDAIQKQLQETLAGAKPEQIDLPTKDKDGKVVQEAMSRETLSKAVTTHFTQTQTSLDQCFSKQAPAAWQLDLELAAAQAALDALPVGKDDAKDAELLAKRAKQSVELQTKTLALMQWETTRLRETARALQKLQSQVAQALPAPGTATLRTAWENTIKGAISTAADGKAPMCV